MNLFRQLNWYFIQKWKQYLISICLLILISILQLFPPKLIGLLIDSIIKKNTKNVKILPWIIMIICIAVTVYIFRYMWRIFLFGAAYQLTFELRIKIYDRISKQNQIFYSKYKSGDLMTRITNDVDKVSFAAGEGVLTLIDSLVMGISVITVMITQINWKLTVFSLIPMPIMVIIINKLGKKMHYGFREVQKTFSCLNNHTQESLNNINLIKSFRLEKYQKQKFFKILKCLIMKNIQVSKINSMFDPIIHLSISISNLIAITVGGWLFWNKIISIGQLTSFIMYLGLMIWPMLALAWMFNIVERGSAAWNRIQSLLIYKKPKNKNYINIPTHFKKLNIYIKYFYYQKHEKKILKNIKFSLFPNQILGVCGPTGSGKSTLFKLIQQQHLVSNGNILYNSIPISFFKINQWRKKIAIADQTTFLFSDTIYNNIAIGKDHASKQEIEEVIYLSNLHKDIKNFPKGFHTQVGEHGIALSGGQKQRISIARALLSNAEILILDNALSAVDGDTELKILKNLETLKKQKYAIILCTHHLPSIANSDKIIVIQKGTIIQKGKHEKLIKETHKWYNMTYSYQKLSKIHKNK